MVDTHINWIHELTEEILEELQYGLFEGKRETNKDIIFSTIDNITQYKVYDQFSENLCGFHAIFNAVCFLHYILNSKDRTYIDKINSPTA